MYQLRDPQSKDNTICLFTDFVAQTSPKSDSQDDVSESPKPGVFVSNETVLNMDSMDSTSYGAVAWSSKTSFNCQEAFNENISYPNPGEGCPELSPCFRRGPAHIYGV